MSTTRFKKLPSIQSDPTDPIQLKRTIDTIYGNTQDIVNNLSSLPVVNGNLIDVDLVINKDNYIETKLGRKYTNYTVYQAPNDVRIWTSQTTNTKPDLFLILQSSQTARVTLWII